MATPGGISGIFNTSNTYLQTDHAKKSFAAQIARLMPNGAAMLFGLTSMLGDELAVATEHGYFAKTMIFPSVALTANAPTAGTSVTAGIEETITVGSTANIVAGMVLQAVGGASVVPTGENLLVVTVTSATQLLVKRNIGGVATLGAALASGMTCYQIGSAYEEASNRPSSLGIIPVRIVNYTQIFRNSWSNSASNEATQMIAGETNVAENKMDCAAFHAVDIEKAIFWGRKSIFTKNSQPVRTMDGLVSILSDTTNYPTLGASSHVYTAGVTTNSTQLEGFLDPCFDQATDPKVANERILFVGGTALKVVNNIGKLNGNYQLTTEETTWGLQFRTYRTARGSFKIVEHPLLNSNSVWAKMAIAVDLSSIRLAYLGNRKTQNKEWNMGGQTVVDNGIDAVGGTLTTECTLVCKNPAANAIIYNMTAGAVG